MKNKPRVPRPPRSPSPYIRHGKTPYPYPGWVTAKTAPPEKIREELAAAKVTAARLVEQLIKEGAN